MKRLVPLPPETAVSLKKQRETGIGYQVVAVELTDGRHFDQVVVSEGCIIAVKGFAEVPFAFHDIAKAEVNHKLWNFRKPIRSHKLKAIAASA
jgi:hypothetical protein